MATRVAMKRVYEPPAPDDGKRILVDRIWPRGLTKEAAKLDLWLKDIAPSTPLRKWYGHRDDRWQEFRRRYRAELDGDSAQLAELRAWIRKGKVTLVYAAKDSDRSNAAVLLEYLGRGTPRD